MLIFLATLLSTLYSILRSRTALELEKRVVRLRARLLSEDADGYHCECTCGNLRTHIKSPYHSQKALPTHQLFHDYDFAIVNRLFPAYSA
jgi:hypothetical protein